MSDRRSAKVHLIAVGLALSLLMSAGAGYRVLASRLERSGEGTAQVVGALKNLPREIGAWRGTDQELDESLIERADVDDHLMRVYRRQNDQSTVGLWIAYGARARDLMPHRPEVCYPGAGWTLQQRDVVELGVSVESEPVRARVLTFASGDYDTRPMTVLAYYIIDGRTCEDASLLRSKAWRGQSSLRYMTQIQISSRASTLSTKEPQTILKEFAEESFDLIRNLLERHGDFDNQVESKQ